MNEMRRSWVAVAAALALGATVSMTNPAFAQTDSHGRQPARAVRPQLDPRAGRALDDAVIRAMASRIGADADSDRVKGKGQVNVKRVDDDGRWVFGSAVLVAARHSEEYPQGWLFVARNTGDTWEVGLEGTAAFTEVTRDAPTQIVTDAEKQVFSIQGAVEIQATDLRTGMRLPWALGQTWTMTGGLHQFDGATGPWSSLDFAGGDQRVLAARGGMAYTMCGNGRGWIRVIHNNSYSTDYYHLWSNIAANGTPVAEGAFLGYTGTDTSCGGAASARHVHFSLRKGGQWVSGVGRLLSAWAFYAGSQPYQGCARMGNTVRCPGQGLYNYGALAPNQGVVDGNGSAAINLRSGPGTNYGIVGSVNDGTIVTISCTGTGTTHTGRYGTTSLWDRLSSGQWMSDAFVYTATDFPVAPSC